MERGLEWHGAEAPFQDVAKVLKGAYSQTLAASQKGNKQLSRYAVVAVSCIICLRTNVVKRMLYDVFGLAMLSHSRAKGTCVD